MVPIYLYVNGVRLPRPMEERGGGTSIFLYFTELPVVVHLKIDLSVSSYVRCINQCF